MARWKRQIHANKIARTMSSLSERNDFDGGGGGGGVGGTDAKATHDKWNQRGTFGKRPNKIEKDGAIRFHIFTAIKLFNEIPVFFSFRTISVSCARERKKKKKIGVFCL